MHLGQKLSIVSPDMSTFNIRDHRGVGMIGLDPYYVSDVSLEQYRSDRERRSDRQMRTLNGLDRERVAHKLARL